jgi:hypothetical protein
MSKEFRDIQLTAKAIAAATGKTYRQSLAEAIALYGALTPRGK